MAGRSWRVWGALVLLVATLATGVAAGVLAVSDLWQLPGATGLSSDLLLLMLWAVLGAVVRAGGPLKLSGPPVLVALCAGALLGEVPAAAILSAGARSKGGAARLALAAAAGGMLGRIGDPAVLLLSGRDPSILLYLAPLGLILAILAGPGREDLDAQASGSGRRTLLLLGVAGAACVPGWALWAVLAGIIGSLILGRARLREVDLRHVAWIGVAAMIGLVGIAGGLPELAATGLEHIGEQLGSWGAPALALGGAALAALSDGTTAAVWSLGVLDGAMSLQIPGAVLGMAAGLAVGGFGPLIAAGAWRAGWKRWSLQVLVTVLYVWLVVP
jgi:hypothetical protein